MLMEAYNPPLEPWLHILYQDEHIMVVNKPSGLLSVPGRLEEHKDSVMTRIQRDFPQAESVHRLDMATSGVIVVALNKAAERELKRQFREREPSKYYVARVWGHPAAEEGLIDLPLICDWPNRPKQMCVSKTAKRRRPSIRCWSMKPRTVRASSLSQLPDAHTSCVCICWRWGIRFLATAFMHMMRRWRWRRVCSCMRSR